MTKENAPSREDPDREARALLEAAVLEVDVTLLDWALSLTPSERLRACYKATSTLVRFRDGASEGR